MSGYASLGYNCEAAYQFRRVVGHDVASYFNWTFNKPSSVIKLIERNFANILDREHIRESGIMIWEDRYDISYHGDVFNKSDHGNDMEAFELHFENLRSKMDFLSQKWLRTVNSDEEMTYFLKLREDSQSQGPSRTVATQVRDTLLAAYPGHRFRIVAVMSLEHSQWEKDWGEPQIFNRYLSFFAPDVRPREGIASEWDQIFAEFPLLKMNETYPSTAA